MKKFLDLIALSDASNKTRERHRKARFLQNANGTPVAIDSCG